MWACIKWPTDKALSSESSPAITPPPITRASVRALCPGLFASDPATPSKVNMAFCPGRDVPPPTVPTSREGMVTLMYKSPLGSFSISVMQLDDSTFWAGSCPVARNMAVTILEACALKPPILPAIADPIKFLAMLTSTRASTVVFSTSWMSLAGIVASATILLPRPSVQFSELGFFVRTHIPAQTENMNRELVRNNL